MVPFWCKNRRERGYWVPFSQLHVSLRPGSDAGSGLCEIKGQEQAQLSLLVVMKCFLVVLKHFPALKPHTEPKQALGLCSSP